MGRVSDTSTTGHSSQLIIPLASLLRFAAQEPSRPSAFLCPKHPSAFTRSHYHPCKPPLFDHSIHVIEGSPALTQRFPFHTSWPTPPAKKPSVTFPLKTIQFLIRKIETTIQNDHLKI